MWDPKTLFVYLMAEFSLQWVKPLPMYFVFFVFTRLWFCLSCFLDWECLEVIFLLAQINYAFGCLAGCRLVNDGGDNSILVALPFCFPDPFYIIFLSCLLCLCLLKIVSFITSFHLDVMFTCFAYYIVYVLSHVPAICVFFFFQFFSSFYMPFVVL